MADWLKPTITSNYVDFVDEVKNRDIDAVTLQWPNPIPQPPVSSVRFNRTAGAVRMQEWNGSAFQDNVISIVGGGTGGATAATARSNLGLGSMAVQQSNGVDITGGIIGPITIRGGSIYSGPTFTMNGTGGATTCMINGTSANYALHVAGHANDGTGGGGILITAGSNPNDYALLVHSADYTKVAMLISGVMNVHVSIGLVIPVGVDKWAK